MSTEVLLSNPSLDLYLKCLDQSLIALLPQHKASCLRGCETRALLRAQLLLLYSPNHIKDLEVLLLSEQVVLLQVID